MIGLMIINVINSSVTPTLISWDVQQAYLSDVRRLRHRDTDTAIAKISRCDTAAPFG